MSDIDPIVYVASSWRNPIQVAVVTALKVSGIECYDFRNPWGGDKGFHWSEVIPSYNHDKCSVDDYIAALDHPRAHEGFTNDAVAMRMCNTCVLVLPCGASAHLELGWFIGQERRTAILLDGPMVTPELMYKFVDYVAPSLFDLLGWLGVKD